MKLVLCDRIRFRTYLFYNFGKIVNILIDMRDKDKTIIQKVVLGAVIFYKDKVLIIQRSANEDVLPNLWELPSGKKENLEDAQDSLKREIMEETGIEIEPIMPFDIFNYQVKKEDLIKDSTQINYLVRPVNSTNKPQVKISSEHQNYAWIRLDQLDKFNLTGSVKQVIKKAFSVNKLLNGS